MRTLRGSTIRDVAKAAGVSSTSVSNFLNSRMDEMSSETRHRIARAIKDLGYTPNSAARQLKTGNAPILGLLVPSVVNPYFGELAVAVDAAAQQSGFKVMLCNTQREPARELVFVQELVSYGVRGILAASVLQNVEAMNALISRGVAFVLFETLGNDPGIERVDTVSMNHRMAAEKAVEYLMSLGHRSIAYVTATPLTPHRISRLNGFRGALQRSGLNDRWVVSDEDISSNSTTHNDADLACFGRYAAIHIAQQPSRPTAVVAMNDLVALGMISGFNETGVRVPDDISLMGFDDIQLAGFSCPALTTMRQPFVQIAESAIERVCARLADPSRSGATISLDPTLIIRASTTQAVRTS